jgi:hypothetical protein
MIIWMLFLGISQSALGGQPNNLKSEALVERQLALDLRENLIVLSISLRPGCEDFSTIAQLRHQKGARVVSLYLSNGETVEPNDRAEYPSHLAVKLREQATTAMRRLDVEPYFLNVEDIAAASDTVVGRMFWPADSIQSKLMHVISNVKPDIILLSKDCLTDSLTVAAELTRRDLLAAVRRIAPPDKLSESFVPDLPLARWKVERLYFEEPSVGGKLPAKAKVANIDMNVRELVDSAAAAYSSLGRHVVKEGRDGSYKLVYPETSNNPSLFDGLPQKRLSQNLATIQEKIQSLTTRILQTDGSKRTLGKRTRQNLVASVVSLIDSVDRALSRVTTRSSFDRRSLLFWRESLESLRSAFLDVRVSFTLSDSVLVGRQVTFLTIDSLSSATKGGTDEILFPAIKDDWIVNEDMKSRLPLVVGETYRLVSPTHVDYHMPPIEYGLQRSSIDAAIPFYIIHHSPSRTENFIHRTSFRVRFAPRFTVEVLNPIVRVVPGESVVVRLTNHTRDGLADTIRVQSAIATSTARAFRLPTKESSDIDTLWLTWNPNLDDGDYLLPVSISGHEVARFAARKFTAQVDTSKRIAIVEAVKGSPVQEAIRRLGLVARSVSDSATFINLAHTTDILLIDRRALSLKPSAAQVAAVQDYAEGGGHVIILAQDAPIWNQHPLVEGLTLSPTHRLDQFVEVDIDTAASLALAPNNLSQLDFDNWLFQRAYNELHLTSDDGFEVPFRSARNGSPMVVSKRIGHGRITYVDFALSPQLMNINPGAFRLLANLISN